MTAKSKTLLLGLVPTRRDLDGDFFCNSKVAFAKKLKIEAKLKEMGIPYVNLDFLNEEGIINNGLDAKKVADYFTEKGVDALFCPHLNFGTEDAIAKIGKLMNKPLLIWGMRDDAPDSAGNRCTDSQCGLFATSKVLQQFHVPYSYMTNCTLDDPTFERVLRNFLSAASVVKTFRGMRVGQVAVRPETFWSVKCNERELLEKFSIEIVPITMVEIQDRFNEILENERELLEKEAETFKEKYDAQVPDDSLIRTAALKLTFRRWAEEMQLDAVASNCWGPIRQTAGIASCFAFSELTGEGLPIACETDVCGAITSVIAQAATQWQKASFFADITVRHPTNDNAELLWHCGVFPCRTACTDCKPVIGRSFDEHRPTVTNFRLAAGDITICRFDGIDGNYQLFMAQGHSVEGPMTKGAYGWFEFDNWPRVEHKLINGPYVHHCAGVHQNISTVLYEACKYIPGLTADPISPGKEEIEEFLI